jgi:hypothetical protein
VTLKNTDSIRHVLMIANLNPMFMLEFAEAGIRTGRFVTTPLSSPCPPCWVAGPALSKVGPPDRSGHTSGSANFHPGWRWRPRRRERR